MRTASAGRPLVRGSVVMRKRKDFIAGGSIETDEPVGASHQIAQRSQSGKGRFVSAGQQTPIGAVGAGEEPDAASGQSLQARLLDPAQRLIDAIKIDLHPL